jgi:hypothetical protein
MNRLFFLILGFNLGLCGLSHSQNIPTVQDTLVNQDTYPFCIEVLTKIKEKDYLELKKMFHVDVLKNVNDSTIKNLVDQASTMVNRYGIPSQESIKLKQRISQTADGIQRMQFYDFPFPTPKSKKEKPDRIITFGFDEKKGMHKLQTMQVKDYATADSILMAKTTKIPFVPKLNFDPTDISWFRIYYSNGATNKPIGNKNGVFAVSGDIETLKNLALQDDVKKMFDFLTNAEIEKTIYKRYGGLPVTNGSPEYIYFRFKFNNPAFEGFEQLTIHTVIEEEKGVKEDEYIVISHSQMNIYYVSKSKNLELFDLLKTFAHRDYGDKLEERP